MIKEEEETKNKTEIRTRVQTEATSIMFSSAFPRQHASRTRLPYTHPFYLTFSLPLSLSLFPLGHLSPESRKQ